ncbi:hypothetical protein V9T40_014904 [Parthenolecanium corni]|uniref:CHK kinase-like domain-containing protein n=1 Tax=Parthenolecanium corni TaxID=536013 RepID=A0AAN9Y762_9HEMI
MTDILNHCFPQAENIKIIRNILEDDSLSQHRTSSVTQLVVEYEQDHKIHQKKLIIKVPTSTPTFAVFESLDFFKREIGMYERVIPRMNKYLDKSLAPVHLYTTDSQILVLEDSVARGFESGKKFQLLDLHQTKSVMKALSHFHAASHQLHIEDPNILDDLFTIHLGILEFRKTGINLGPIVLELLRRKNETHLIGIVEAAITFLENDDDAMRAFLDRSKFKFIALNHGDARKDNCLYKYTSSGQVEAQLVDFQLSLWSSPLLDITFFLTTSASLDSIEFHFDDLIDGYLNELNEKLIKMNCASTYSRSDFDNDLRALRFYLIYSVLCSCITVSSIDQKLIEDVLILAKADIRCLYDACLNDAKFVNIMHGRQNTVNMTSLNSDLMTDILKHCFPQAENIKIIGNMLEDDNLSEHFTSSVTQLVVEYEQDHKIHQKQLIIKVPTSSPTFAFFESFDLFKREIGMYERVIPRMNKYLDTTLAPAHLYTTDSKILVLENLIARGFESGKKLSLLDSHQTKSVMKALSHFHAASHQLHLEDPNILDDLFTIHLGILEFRKNIINWGLIVLELLRRKNETHLIGIVEAAITFLEKDDDAMRAFLDRSKFKFIALNHGDARKDNFLYKYTSSGQVEAQLVDFQGSLWSSPLLDIIYFLISSASLNLIEFHFDDLIDGYLDELNEKLIKMNCGSTYSRSDFDKDLKALRFYLIYSVLFSCGDVSPIDQKLIEDVFILAKADIKCLYNACLNDAKFFVPDGIDTSSFHLDSDAMQTSKFYRGCNWALAKIKCVITTGSRISHAKAMASTSKDLVLSILKLCFPAADNIRIIHDQLEEGQRHLTSDVTRFIVELEQDHETRRKHVAMKIPTTSSDFLAYCERLDVYNREITMYEKVIPRINKYLDKSLAPAHLYTTDSKILVLEDLTARGYVSGEKLALLNLAETKSVMKAFAHYHSASHKLYVEDPGILENFLYSCFEGFKWMEIIAPWKSIVLELLRRKNDTRLIPKVEAAFLYLEKEKVSTVLDRSKFKFLALNHGDSRKDNFLFKHSENQVQVQFVDYQCCFCCSPAFDISIFWPGSVSVDVLEAHFDDLIDEYLHELNADLKKLGCASTYERTDFDSDSRKLRYFSFFSFICLCVNASSMSRQDVEDMVHPSETNVPNFLDKCLKEDQFVRPVYGLLKFFEKLKMFDEL